MTLIRNLGMAALGGIAYLASACVPAQVATKPVTPVVEAKKKPKVDLEEFYGNLKLLVEKTLKNGEKLTGNFLEEMTYGAKGIKNPVDCSSLARYNTSKGDFALVVANSENRFAKYQGDFDDDSDPSMSLMINGLVSVEGTMNAIACQGKQPQNGLAIVREGNIPFLTLDEITKRDGTLEAHYNWQSVTCPFSGRTGGPMDSNYEVTPQLAAMVSEAAASYRGQEK